MLARLLLSSVGPARGRETQIASGPSEARAALDLWRARLAGLSLHRRVARRETRLMVSRWRARLVRAHLDRRLGYVAFALEPLVIVLGRTRRDHMRRLLRVLVCRMPIARWRLVAAATIAVASLVGLAVLAGQPLAV